MSLNHKIRQLEKIWANIPKAETEQDVLPQDVIVKKFLNLFHPGEFFYSFFNTQTGIIEYVSPEIGTILGYPIEEYTLSFFSKYISSR